MKLAFIGTGKIVKDALGAVQPIKEIRRAAIYARPHSLDTGRQLAEEFGVREVYTDYEKLLRESDADTVYIGLVNPAHYAYAKEALLSKKNVILEKPFTAMLSEAEDLFRTAEENGVFVFEAVTVLHTGMIPAMRDNLGKLGPIRMVLANYSQYSGVYDDYLAGNIPHALDRAYLGGALFDINVYNIHYCVSLFGRPEQVEYYPNHGQNGVDTSGTLILRYEGFTASLTGAKDSDSPCFFRVQGEKGCLGFDNKPNIADLLTVTAVEDRGEKVRDAAGAMVRKTVTETIPVKYTGHRMESEFREFRRIIDLGDREAAKALAEETRLVMDVLERTGVYSGSDSPSFSTKQKRQ